MVRITKKEDSAKTPKVHVTTDYDRFVNLEGNRTVQSGRVKKIIESINKVGFIMSPIIVNEKMEVIDGQGRLAALKELELPVYYIIVEGIGIKECISMNIHQSNWKLSDYIQSYAIRGNRNYARLQSLIDRYPMIPSDIVIYAASKLPGGTSRSAIKEGKFKLSENEKKDAEWALDYAKSLADVAKTVGGRKAAFYQAVIFSYRQLDISGRTRLKTCIQSHRYDFPSFTKAENFLEYFEKMYNKGLKKEKHVYLKHAYETQ